MQKKQLPTRKRIFTVESAEDKAKKAKQENDRNRNIAYSYFSEVPSLPNLARGSFYWIKGNLLGNSENVEDYKVIKGEPMEFGVDKKRLTKGIVREVSKSPVTKSVISQILGWSKTIPERGFLFKTPIAKTMNAIKVSTPALGIADVASNLYSFSENPQHQWAWNPVYSAIGAIPKAYNTYITNRKDSSQTPPVNDSQSIIQKPNNQQSPDTVIITQPDPTLNIIDLNALMDSVNATKYAN